MTANAVRLKHICHLGYGDALPKDEESIGDVPVFGSNGQYTTTSESNTKAPVIVIGRKGSYGKVNWSSTEVFASDTTFFVDTRFTKVNLRWLYWSIQTFRLDEGSQEAAVPGLNREWVYEQRTILPDLKEQSLIANYLDRETIHIDTLITEKERMLTLLEEKRAALISQAVTRGLDPDVPLKASDQLGDNDTPPKNNSGDIARKSMERQWSTRRIKSIANLNMGQSPPSELVDKFDEKGGLPFLQGNAEFGDEFPSPLHACSEPAKVAKKGDLLISVRAPVGALNIADQDYGIGRGLCAILWTNLHPRFGWWAMHYQRSQLDLNATGSTYVAVSVEDVSNVKLSYPDPALQNKIANYLDHETKQIDILSKEISSTIELLKERRSALITAAVTGQIDLEEIVA